VLAGAYALSVIQVYSMPMARAASQLLPAAWVIDKKESTMTIIKSGAPTLFGEQLEAVSMSEYAASRRHFVLGASSILALASLPLPNLGWASPQTAASAGSVPSSPATLTGNIFDLHIGYQKVNFTGTERIATTVNNGLPGPTLRWKEGEEVTLRVTNNLKEVSSIHWHGIILPSAMDGVPDMSFEGIKPGETFEYRFKVQQYGTYWYHSHSNFQEQTGLYGAIIIEPKAPPPFAYDRELIVILSDWTDETPQHVYAKLKKMSDYYNFHERTVGDTWRDITTKGIAQTWKDRTMWNQMRMSQTDLSDVTGYTYTYLMNGVSPDQGWLALWTPGEKIRLRFINGAAMSIFDVRIPGLKMTVVAADGQYIQPVAVDEFRMGVAEVYDVIVEPEANRAYTLFAQSIDRTGYARGTLTTNPELPTEVPAMDKAPLLGHGEMGMGSMASINHSGHDMGKMDSMDMSGMGDMDMSGMGDMDMSKMEGMDMSTMDMSGMDHSGHGMKKMSAPDKAAKDHRSHDMSKMDGMDMGNSEDMKNNAAPLAKAGFGSNFDSKGELVHPKTESGLADPGIGLRDNGRRVLTYADLRGLYPTRDRREPSREIELHFTGNMRRYMWSINGVNFMDAAPIQLTFGERVRIILVNDTMMTHPIHLHGMWSELETGDPDYIPRKHTSIVHPGSKVSYLVTADAMGRWAYHCHLLYHMPGMMREVRVI
jgi:CopA family copper-resistance protein